MRLDRFIVKEGVSFGGMVKPSESDAKLIRLSIMEELQAVNDYLDRANKCENEVLRKVFLDIAHEERVHFGELEELLEAIDPLHEPAEEEAEGELDDMFGSDDE